MKTRYLYILAFLFSACGSQDSFYKPELKNLTEAVYASGNLYPLQEYRVYANADGLLNSLHISPGDEVAQGEFLFSIGSEMQDARRESTAEIYKIAQANLQKTSPMLKEAEALLETALVKLENDSLHYLRYQNLLAGNAIAKADYDKALLAFTVARNDYQARKSSLNKLKQQLYVELQQARSQHRVSASEDKNHGIKALLSGLVYEVYKENGEAVRRNEPIALIGNHKEVLLKLSVDEADIARVQPGQEVLVKMDLLQDKLFRARVSKIHPKLNVQDQSFRVDALFTGDAPQALYGLTVEANIIVQERENVFSIPKSLLLPGDSLWVKTEKGEQKVRIQRGVEDFDFVEVVGGIDHNTLLIKK